MIFINDLSNSKPLNTYNNNIIKYKASNTTKTLSHSEISINGIKDELTPNLNDEFRYNFLQIAKALNNLNNFNDELNDSKLVYHDTSLHHELKAEIKIIFTDGTEEKETKVYKFLKSVDQIIEQKYEVDNKLYPLTKHNFPYTYLTYFEGYPYDLAFYSDTNREIKIYHKKTQHEIKLKAKKGVNRLIVSNGKSNISLNDVLPLYIGYNELEFKTNNEVLFTIILKKVDAKRGVYLKWFNQSGAFSYWLFPDHAMYNLSDKIITNLENNFENLQDSHGNFSITGKAASHGFTILSQPLSNIEFDYLKTIFLSPKVEILNDYRYLTDIKKDWKTVKITSGRITKRPKQIGQYIPIKITLPNLYTQTL